MKTIIATLALSAALSAQTAPVVNVVPTLPTLGMLGASFNQTGTPRWNLLASAIYQQPGLNSNWYASTSVDGIPIQRVINGQLVYSLNFSVRQGINYVVYRSDTAAFPAFTLFLGGDLGAGFQQAAPSGTNVNWAAAASAGGIRRLGGVNSHLGLAFIVRAIHLAGDAANVMTPIVEGALVYKFN